MEQFFNSITNNNNGGGGNGQQGFPMPQHQHTGSRSTSVGSRSNSINAGSNNMNNINMNVLAGMLQNQRGVQQQQQQQMNMNMGQMGQMQQHQQLQQMNFMNQNGGFGGPQQQMGNNSNRRQSDASVLSQSSAGMNNHYSNKALLNMLDDDIEYNQHQNQKGQGPHGHGPQGHGQGQGQHQQQGPHQQQPQDQDDPANLFNNINFNNASQQQQTQLLMAMHQRMQQQRNNMTPSQQNQMPMQQQNQGQMQENQGQMNPNQMSQNQGPMQQGHMQLNQMQQGHMQLNQMQQGQMQSQGQLQQMQQNLVQMQQNLAQMQNQQSPPPQQIAQRQQQIQEFLQRHGHNLSDHQRSNLQQQLGGGGAPTPNPGAGPSNMNPMNNSGGGGGGNNIPLQAMAAITNMGGMQTMQAMAAAAAGSNPSQGDSSVLSMDDLMVRQREQLRHLQVMLKTQDEPGKSQGGGSNSGMSQQQLQQQQMAQAAINFRLQTQRQRQNMTQQSEGQAQQNKQTVSAEDLFGGQMQQQSPSGNTNQQQQQQLQQLQMQHQAQSQQHQQPQQKVSSAVMEQMIRQRQQQMDGQQKEPPQKHQRQRSQESISEPTHHMSNSQGGKKSKSPLSTQSLSPPMSSAHQSRVSSAEASAVPPSSATANNTRVVPVALSPRYTHEVQHGGVSESALIYTKHALNSIVLSLNSKSEGGRVYTIRDLSTCLGAWDLSVPSNSCAGKRQKTEEGRANFNDGNADTAFNFYHERLCPILLDSKRPTGGAIPFSVEDFGEGRSADENLPALTGAVALTFGADHKFTGGIGEEGVLTKAIFEFFYEPVVALGEDGSEKDMNIHALVEAEEQLFARLDSEHSSFIQAALHALSPSLAGEDEQFVDKKVYVPTIWSGNTNRVYQYCLLGNFDDDGKELASKRLCVAIQKKALPDSNDGPSKGVCRITLTLSPASVIAEKKRMANAREGQNLNEASSAIHRKIRQNLRCLRPPKLVSASSFPDNMGPGRRRVNLRRPSVTHLIDPSLIVVGMRCKHELLLDAVEVGKVYINGSLVVDCSISSPDKATDKTIAKANNLSALGTLGPDVLPAHTLFGIDFTFPTRQNAMFFRELPSKALLEQEYGALLVDALIDATQFESDVAGKLLGRLITSRIEGVDDDEHDDGPTLESKKDGQPTHHRVSSKSSYDGEDDCEDDLNSTPSPTIKFDVASNPCIESIVLSSAVADPVGIGAKALGTKFRMQYGEGCFPCEVGTDEEYRLCKVLGPCKVAKPVPRRVRDILRRGGFLPLDDMASFIWKKCCDHWEGDHDDSMRASEAMESAIQLLRQAGCSDVNSNMVRFAGRKQLGNADVSLLNSRCWYDARRKAYYVNDSILFVERESPEHCGEEVVSDAKELQQPLTSTATGKQRDGSHKEPCNGGTEINGTLYVSEQQMNSADEKVDEAGDDLNIKEENVHENAPMDAAWEQSNAVDDTAVDDTDNAIDRNTFDKAADCLTVKQEHENGIESCADSGSMNDCNDVAVKGKPNTEDGHEISKTEAASNDASRTKGDDAAEMGSSATNGDHHEGREDESTSSEKTDKVMNSSKETEKESNAKPRYRPAKEAAYILGLSIAREHPNTMTLEKYLSFHSS